jgi:hypothetical protein
VKKFVLARGRESGTLYLYTQDVWEYVVKSLDPSLEFVTDNDDPEVLKQFQKVVNDDLYRELTNVRTRDNH